LVFNANLISISGISWPVQISDEQR